jgi:hypothetical protein
MDSPEDANMKAPRGVNLPLGPFFPSFKNCPFFTKTKYIFKKEVTMKPREVLLSITLALFVAPLIADAQQPGKVPILGIWRLVSSEMEYQATGQREKPRGNNPTGYLILSPEGRMMVVLTNEGRKAPKTDQDRADLFNAMVAFTGIYRIEGDKWVTKVDVHMNPALVDTEQPRFFRVDGDRILEMTDWSDRPGKGMGRVVNTWERAK